jgi:hypothetical protein
MEDRFAPSLRTLGCLILLVASLNSCAQPPWFAFKPQDGSFLAQFPVEPTKSIKTIDTALGQTDVTFYTASEKQQTYSVTVAEYSADHIKEVGPAAFLDEARDGAIANTRGKLVSETSFDLKGNPGRDISLNVGGSSGSFRYRLILVGNRLYQVIVAGPSDQADASQVKRFLDSFSLP